MGGCSTKVSCRSSTTPIPTSPAAWWPWSRRGRALFEFTNRSALAIEAFRAAAAHSSKHLPRMILGAGSIVDEPTAALSIAQGAEIIKLFPALAAGGPDFIRQILGPSSTGPPPMT